MALQNTMVKEEKEAACDDKIKKILSSFSGSMSNCTININV